MKLRKVRRYKCVIKTVDSESGLVQSRTRNEDGEIFDTTFKIRALETAGIPIRPNQVFSYRSGKIKKHRRVVILKRKD